MCMHILFSCYCKKYVCMMKRKRKIAMLNKLTIEHVDEDRFIIVAELTENELPCYDFDEVKCIMIYSAESQLIIV